MALKNQVYGLDPVFQRDDDFKNELRHSLGGRDPGRNPSFKDTFKAWAPASAGVTNGSNRCKKDFSRTDVEQKS